MTLFLPDYWKSSTSIHLWQLPWLFGLNFGETSKTPESTLVARVHPLRPSEKSRVIRERHWSNLLIKLNFEELSSILCDPGKPLSHPFTFLIDKNWDTGDIRLTYLSHSVNGFQHINYPRLENREVYTNLVNIWPARHETLTTALFPRFDSNRCLWCWMNQKYDFSPLLVAALGYTILRFWTRVWWRTSTKRSDSFESVSDRYGPPFNPSPSY